jgi:hypothetical protein
MIVIKTAAYGGGETTKMAQKLAETYLGKLIEKARLPNLKQAMNDAFGGRGKACGNYTYNGHKPLHASAGKPDRSSVTLFYYPDPVGETLYCFAMGEHLGSSSYTISDFGPATGDFKKGTKIALS